MCELTMGLIAAGTALSAGGALQQGLAQSAASKYNAKIAENNATAAQQQADFSEKLQRERSARALASQRVAIGKSGVTREGSALDVLAESAAEAEMDARAIRYGGELESNAYRAQAALDKHSAKMAKMGGYIGAGTALFSGLTSMAQSGYYSNPNNYLTPNTRRYTSNPYKLSGY